MINPSWSKDLITEPAFSSLLFYIFYPEFRLIKDPSDKVKGILARVDELQENAKNTAIEQCLANMDCPDGDLTNLTSRVVKELADKYKKMGIIGDITSDWSNLCLIIPVRQALDVIKHNRQSVKWGF